MKGNILPHSFLFLVHLSILSSSYVYGEQLCVGPELRQREEGCFRDPEKIGTRFKLRPLQTQVHLQFFKGRRGREQQFHVVCKTQSLKDDLFLKRVGCGRHRNRLLKKQTYEVI